MKRLAGYFLLTLILHEARAQSFAPIHYSIAEGLPSSEVYQVFQDSKGFIWFATDVGVVKYDGSEMQKFGIQEGLTDPVVFGFHEDYKGRIWFRTFSGRICYYDDQKIHPYKYNDTLAKLTQESIVGSFLVDSLEQLWFSTHMHKGVYGRIDSTGKVFAKYPENFEFYYEKVGDMEFYGHRQKDVKSISINNKIFPLVVTDNICHQWLLKSVVWGSKQYFSICSNLFEFDGQSLKRVSSGGNAIISMYVDRDNYLWVGYLNGTTERYTDASFKEKWTPDFLKGVSVSNILQDSEGAYWFSTLEQGVFYIPNFSIQNIKLDTDVKIKSVVACRDEVLVGLSDGEVKVFSAEGVEKKSYPFEPLVKLHVDRNDDIWLVDKSGTYFLTPDFKLKRHFKVIAFSHLSESPDGTLFSLTGRTQIGTINREEGTSQFKFSGYTYRTLFADDSVVYMATRDGLHMYGHNLEFIREIPEFRNHKISKFAKLSNTTLLVGTVGSGFLVFNTHTGKVNRYNAKSNFVANNIYQIVISDSAVWLATEKGVVKMNVNSLINGNPEQTLISRQNGLISNQIAHLVAAGQYVWAFSDHGFSLVNKNSSELQSPTPRFYLKDVTVGNSPFKLKEGTELSPSQNDVHFDFGFISFQNQNIFLRYRLRRDHAWTYTQNKSLQFNSLAPGDYALEIQHSADNVKWADAYKSPAFTILPPVYQTWYFLTAVALLLLGIILLYFRNQVAIYRRHQQKLIQSEITTIEKERSRIAKDLHDSVGTDFTAIKMTVGQLLKKHNEPKSDEIETQFQGTIQEIKTIIYGLAPPGLERYGLIAGLKNYVEKLDGAVPVKIKFDSFGPEIKDAALSITVFRIVQELVSNSLKHSNADTISLHVNSFEDLLNIVYEDNGKGFSWDTSSKGLGLYNIESRLQAVKGKLKFDSGEFGISYTIDIPSISYGKVS